MPADARQLTANTLYSNLMDEAKARIACIASALQGRMGVPAAIVREVGFLQLRMLCELIALSCLTAHGDIKAVQASKLSKEYAADKIIEQLDALHPNFYPYPVNMTITHGSHGSHGNIQLDEKNDEYLTKSGLPILYGRCGTFLHRGTARKLLSSMSPVQMQLSGKDFSEIASWTTKIIKLLETHRISSIDNLRHLIVILSAANEGGRVQVAYAESPPPHS